MSSLTKPSSPDRRVTIAGRTTRLASVIPLKVIGSKSFTYVDLRAAQCSVGAFAPVGRSRRRGAGDPGWTYKARGPRDSGVRERPDATAEGSVPEGAKAPAEHFAAPGTG